MHGRQGQGIRYLDHGIDHLGQERRLDPRPPDPLDARTAVQTQAGIARLVKIEEHRTLGIGAQHPGAMLAITHITTEGRRGAAGTRAGNQPARFRMPLEPQLLENRLGDVVVRPPVSGPLGVGELVHEMTTALPGQALGLRVNLRRVLHQMALAAVEGDLRDLFLGSGGRHHRDKRQAQQPCEVGFGDRRRTAGRLDHRRARAQPAIAQGIEEQRTRKTVLQAAGRMAGFVLEVQLDARQARQRQRDQVGVGTALEVGFNDPDRFPGPLSVVAHDGYSSWNGGARKH